MARKPRRTEEQLADQGEPEHVVEAEDIEAAPPPEPQRFVLVVDGEETETEFSAHEQNEAFAALAELREEKPDADVRLLDRSTQTRY